MRRWDEYRRAQDVRTPDGVRVSLNDKGIIALNPQAAALLGDAEFVVLLFDQVMNSIGLRPVQLRQSNAVRINRNGRDGRYRISAIAFCRYYKIKPDVTMVFRSTTMEGSIMVLDLGDAFELYRPHYKSKRKEMFRF